MIAGGVPEFILGVFGGQRKQQCTIFTYIKFRGPTGELLMLGAQALFHILFDRELVTLQAGGVIVDGYKFIINAAKCSLFGLFSVLLFL